MDATLHRAATQVVIDLAENGGGTYEWGTLLPFKPDTGFAVGVGGTRYPADAFDASTAAWLLKATGSEYGEVFVGTWLDSGTVYVDAVRYFNGSRRKDALLLGYQHEQKAIYDFGMAESIILGEEPIE